jgi:formylglycine-generating enzyme required for sulfatase activity
MVHLFLGYRKTSADWRDEVMAALSRLPAIDGGETWPLTIWSDDHLLGGDDWAREIGVHIDHADLFLLLVTSDLTGGYALETELHRAAERARVGPCRVIPIIVDNVMAFLRTYGLDEFRRHAIPRGGVGLSQRPYSGDKSAWLNDVVEDVKAAILAILGSAQMQGPDMAAAFEACAAAAHEVLEVAESDREALVERLPVVTYAAARTLDALRSDTPRILDLLVTPRRLVQDARRAATGAGAARTVQALKDLTADLDDLSDAARRAGLIARTDTASGPSPIIDRGAADNAADLAGLGARLDEVDRAAEGLAEEAQLAPPSAQAAIQEAAERLGAESRLVRAASEDPQMDAAEIEATTEQLDETMRAVSALPVAELSPRARGFIGFAREAVGGAVRFVKRIVARAFGRHVPAPNFESIGVADRAPVADAGAPPVTLFLRRHEAPVSPWAIEQGEDRFGAFARLALGDVTQTLRWIPPGRFLMGSPDNEPGRYVNEGPIHEVTISAGFWLFDTPCTQSLWETVMGSNESRSKSPDRPVDRVNWNDCQDFIAWINARVTGLKLVLPTEAQWEYACRAGSDTAIYSGPIPDAGEAPMLDPIAWWSSNSWRGTHPVGRLAPNAWGLYDMLGNVWEWCIDSPRSYGAAPVVDPVGPTEHGDSRVLRGGSWDNPARYCRSAFRGRSVPGGRSSNFGFRCARVQA